VLPADYTFTLADAGSHTFHVSLLKAGDQTVSIRDSLSGGTQTAHVAVAPSAPTHIEFASAPDFAFVRSIFNIVVIDVLDGYGKPRTQRDGLDCPVEPPPPLVLRSAIDDGVAVFLPSFLKPGSYVLTATSGFGSPGPTRSACPTRTTSPSPASGLSAPGTRSTSRPSRSRLAASATPITETR